MIALVGTLGAGKTAFARAFVRALGDPDADVPSPTFTLVQTYDVAPAPVWHMDAYRLKAAEEAYELGIEEAFAEGITLIEWPDRLESLLPADRLDLRLEIGPEPGKGTARRAVLAGGGDWPQRLAGLHV